MASLSSNLIDNASSPYFLHHGDSPGAVLVSQPLTGDNYSTWSRSMSMALSAKNKLGFIDGSISRPSQQTDKLFDTWSRCNNMVLSWILNSVSKDLATSIIFIDTAAAVWKDLKERFSQSNAPRIFQLQQAISSLSQNQQSVSHYFTQLKGLWDELNNFRPLPACTCGASKTLLKYQQQEQVMYFLMGLNESYSLVRGQVLLMDPLPPINKVFSLILQEERQREVASITHPAMEPAALLSHHTPHLPRNDAKRGPPPFKRERPFCNHCHIHGHTTARCYKLHGYPPGHRLYQPPSANQVSSTDIPTATPQLPFTKEQCEQLLGLLNISSSQPMANHVSAVT
ncbi:hypothetical protein F0562_027533 [Nyssa sinensis]|uniref:Retrotransposon Copia-like N-terminal domain-containing protein n=1 Tax=Nyssa sinensis TaxID=561372 RepID=A0A5J5B7Z9_9ASTE|nr:hypothetical protein F0562_027533 [Nyssa sinensis]